MQVFILPPARQEIHEAFDWYEAQRSGLGSRFSSEFYDQLDRIAGNPLRFQLITGDVRRARLHTFPYGIFFRFDRDSLFILACLHSRRDPAIWKNRI